MTRSRPFEKGSKTPCFLTLGIFSSICGFATPGSDLRVFFNMVPKAFWLGYRLKGFWREFAM